MESMATRYLDKLMDLRWTYAGVNTSHLVNGGEECANFLPDWQKIAETILFGGLAILELCYAYPRIKLPESVPNTELKGDRTGRKFMLMIMCIIFGIEIGFKCATRQLIFILNPCHVITIIQIFLLVAPPKRYTTAVFRVSMHCLSGATIAILFPVTDTRTFPFEAETYYIQHALILVIPYYFLRLGGAFTPEPLHDLSWDILSCGILFLYHFTFLQPLGMLIHINLNNMQCPAPSDPFFGRWYRSAAVLHQHATVLLHGKFYTWLAFKFLPRRHPGATIDCAITDCATSNGGAAVVGQFAASKERLVCDGGFDGDEVSDCTTNCTTKCVTNQCANNCTFTNSANGRFSASKEGFVCDCSGSNPVVDTTNIAQHATRNNEECSNVQGHRCNGNGAYNGVYSGPIAEGNGGLACEQLSINGQCQQCRNSGSCLSDERSSKMAESKIAGSKMADSSMAECRGNATNVYGHNGSEDMDTDSLLRHRNNRHVTKDNDHVMQNSISNGRSTENHNQTAAEGKCSHKASNGHAKLF